MQYSSRAAQATAELAHPDTQVSEISPLDLRPFIAADRHIRFGEHRYPHLVRSGMASLAEFGDLVAGLDPCSWVLVIDQGVPRFAVQAVTEVLADLAPVIALEVPAEETGKTWQTVGELGDEAILRGATRRAVIVALGGGLVGNVAGMLAHNFFRGAPLVLLPTTLLAASDSTLSLKQAVNSRFGKNHFGAFHRPALVWTQLDFLQSLPADELRAAFCEAIKNVVAICPQRYQEFAAHLRADACYSPDDLAWMIGFCADAKQSVMIDDAHEKGPALAALEIGHLVAHATEMRTHGALSHGLAVGLGGLVAGRTATALGFAGPQAEEMFEDLLTRNGAPVTFRQAREHVPAGPARQALDDSLPAALVEIARHDNKQGYRRRIAGHLPEVLLDAPGRVHRTDPEQVPALSRRTLSRPALSRPALSRPALSRPDSAAATYITQVPEAVLHAAIAARVG